MHYVLSLCKKQNNFFKNQYAIIEYTQRKAKAQESSTETTFQNTHKGLWNIKSLNWKAFKVPAIQK